LDAKAKKIRIDNLLTERGLVKSRARGRSLIMAGKVRVDGQVVDKAGRLVSAGSLISIKEGIPYVSRGGIKLAGFLDEFKVECEGLVVLDVGASTGGFTDCLLKRGVSRVIAVDVGKGILDYSLRNDPRVRVIEGRNIRYLEPTEVGEKVDLAVIDVSFISLEKVLPRVKGFLKEGGPSMLGGPSRSGGHSMSGGRILALVKPQFEVGKGEVGKGGIVTDPEKHRRVVKRIQEFALTIGLRCIAESESPITGAKGNREFWVYLAS
jgi:23S rRNA (cytidine1920-2'-O)/16S rRNA (cytidine1409-2'-O)-methyltransferase